MSTPDVKPPCHSTEITTAAVAALLGVTTPTVRRYADAGHLPCRVLPSGVRRFRREDVLALLPPTRVSA